MGAALWTAFSNEKRALADFERYGMMSYRQLVLMKSKIMKSKKPNTIANQLLMADRLAQVAWYEALARITSGLVHDTNNCLAGVVSLSEHCIELGGGGKHSFKEEFTLINQAGHKAGEILRNFVQLNPFKPQEPTYYDLNVLATESVEVLQRALKRKLDFELQLGPGPLPVFLQGLEIKKAIICMAFNLADSIPEAGTIVFHTSSGKDQSVKIVLSSTNPESAKVDWSSLFIYSLTGDQWDLFRLRFSLIQQAIEKADGELCAQFSKETGTRFEFTLPRASLD
jgi:hypothetical protein